MSREARSLLLHTLHREIAICLCVFEEKSDMEGGGFLFFFFFFSSSMSVFLSSFFLRFFFFRYFYLFLAPFFLSFFHPADLFSPHSFPQLLSPVISIIKSNSCSPLFLFLFFFFKLIIFKKTFFFFSLDNKRSIPSHTFFFLLTPTWIFPHQWPPSVCTSKPVEPHPNLDLFN